jgi:hypothetical protein
MKVFLKKNIAILSISQIYMLIKYKILDIYAGADAEDVL